MDKENPTILKNSIKDNFTVVTNQVINDANLGWAAKGVMCYLLSKPTGWQFFIGDIVKHAQCTLYQVQKLLKELEDNGYLRRYKTVHTGTNKLYWAWEINGVKENLRQGEIATIVNCDNRRIAPYSNTNSTDGLFNNINIIKKPNTDFTDTPITPKGAVDGETQEHWEKFWTEYVPVKTKDGIVSKGSKKLAEKKYKQLLSKGVKPDDILRGLRAYLSYCQNNGRLTCGVAVFLNQERWKDDYGGAVALARQQNKEEQKQQEQMDIYRRFLENNK